MKIRAIGIPMNKTNRLLTITNVLLAMILMLVLVQFAPTAASANSSTIVACANKKSGALRIAYKKCKKKERAITWGSTGPQGPAGPQGAPGATGSQGATGSAGQDRSGFPIIRDGSGRTVSNIVETNWANGGPHVKVGNLVWGFNINTGQAFALSGEQMAYTNSNCLDGFGFSRAYPDVYLHESRTIQFVDEAYIPLEAVHIISDLEPESGPVYYINHEGNCTLDQTHELFYFVEEVTPPAALPAPLTISFN